MKKNYLLTFLFFAGGMIPAFAQDLLGELDDSLKSDAPDKEYVISTFKGARIVNGHSIEIPDKNEMIFIIGHRFGRVDQGANFLGLDQATIRLGLEYSPLKWLNVGIGRSSYQKTVDGFVKANILRQRRGKKPFPFHLTYVGGMAWSTMPWTDPNRKNYFTSRLSYVNQLLIARKFSDRVSLQLMPTMIHKNLVPLKDDNNDLYAMGIGGRVKVTRRVAICAEYFYLLNEFPTVNTLPVYSPVAIGVDIETGGHIFQLQFTNAQAMFEKGFIAETTGDFFKGNIHFGFNITRTFSF